MVTTINWKATPKDKALIEQILDRAIEQGFLRPKNRNNTRMDLTACHLNGSPLRLADLLATDDFNFLHDLRGIDRHMNRETGQLGGYFVPRFIEREEQVRG
jgi:hypothetical protein